MSSGRAVVAEAWSPRATGRGAWPAAYGPPPLVAAAGQFAAPAPDAAPSAAAPSLLADAPFCATLPSSTSAHRFVSGEPGAWVYIVRDLVLRGGLIGIGLALYDRRDPHIVKRALAGSAMIELFVLTWSWLRLPRPPSPAPR